jgi:AraC-like DNA-binding protein
MVMVSPLLRELVGALGSAPAPAREAHLAALLVDELGQCGTQNLGVPMPNAQYGDKRLLNLCEAVLRAPGERANLAQWVADVGASERTIARLFREQLGMPYQQWHQQAILAHALPMLARGLPVAQVAAATGYASGGAFSAMFKSAMGQAPSHFQSQRFLHATP